MKTSSAFGNEKKEISPQLAEYIERVQKTKGAAREFEDMHYDEIIDLLSKSLYPEITDCLECPDDFPDNTTVRWFAPYSVDIEGCEVTDLEVCLGIVSQRIKRTVANAIIHKAEESGLFECISDEKLERVQDALDNMVGYLGFPVDYFKRATMVRYGNKPLKDRSPEEIDAVLSTLPEEIEGAARVQVFLRDWPEYFVTEIAKRCAGLNHSKRKSFARILPYVVNHNDLNELLGYYGLEEPPIDIC